MLTFDTELAWGTRGRADLKPDYDRTRETIRRILGILEKRDVAATWATVGHLFLDRCCRLDGVAHPEIVRPKRGDGDWYDEDPATSEERDPLWYGSDILGWIRGCATRQEIGCHTFGHIRSDVPGFGEAAFRSDLEACRRAADEKGISLKSFVYPENRVAFVPALKEFGFECFRSGDTGWYASLPGPWSRIAHVLDQFLNPSAPVSDPVMRDGIWELKGSMYLAHAHGWGAWLSDGQRVRKARNGIRLAAETGKTFHLWTHPFNLASDPERLIPVLDRILDFACEERSKGRLEILTMAACASKLAL